MDRITVTFRKSDSDYFATVVFTMRRAEKTSIHETMRESSKRVELREDHYEMLPSGRISPQGAGSVCLCGIMWGLRKADALSPGENPESPNFAVTIEEVYGFLDHPYSSETFSEAGAAGVALYIGRPEFAKTRWGDDWLLTEYSVSDAQ